MGEGYLPKAEKEISPTEAEREKHLGTPFAFPSQAVLERLTADLDVWFQAHNRGAETVHIEPHPVILVDGILIFYEPALRALFDVKIYVDTDADLRFIRRLQRDITERGRTTESVVQQYLATVRPMHNEFVEPSKRYADVIIPEGGLNTVALDMVTARIEALLHADEEGE